MDEARWDELVEKAAELAGYKRLEWPDFIDGLPNKLPKKIDLWITGGLALNGFTCHDLDFYAKGGDEVLYMNFAIYELFYPIYRKHAHVGNIIYSLRPTPVIIQLYEQGVLKDRTFLKTLVKVLKEKIPQENGYIADLRDRISAVEILLGIK
jgi:hypothetical protein